MANLDAKNGTDARVETGSADTFTFNGTERLSPAAPSRLRICLAGSGGGHVRQLLDLQPAWASHDCFFVTEDTALSRSLSQEHRTHYISHYAFGQARLGAPVRMLISGARNFVQSAWIMFRERPDVFITTGAGAVFFSLLWARMLGATVVVIESLARFNRLSKFARLAAPFAHHKVVQSAALSAYWPDAAVFDPMRILDLPRLKKKNLLFVTVGATLPFNRLVETVAKLKVQGEIPENVLIQTGVGGLVPDGIETVETLPFDQMLSLLRDADVVVCHGGTGSLITALRQGCRVVVMPRAAEMGEHYDNHQSEIVEAFAARGLVVKANSSDELAAALRTVRSRTAKVAASDPTGLIDHLQKLFSQFSTNRKHENRWFRTRRREGGPVAATRPAILPIPNQKGLR